jgi:hypothetical protein
MKSVEAVCFYQYYISIALTPVTPTKIWTSYQRVRTQVHDIHVRANRYLIYETVLKMSYNSSQPPVSMSYDVNTTLSSAICWITRDTRTLESPDRVYETDSMTSWTVLVMLLNLLKAIDADHLVAVFSLSKIVFCYNYQIYYYYNINILRLGITSIPLYPEYLSDILEPWPLKILFYNYRF